MKVYWLISSQFATEGCEKRTGECFGSFGQTASADCFIWTEEEVAEQTQVSVTHPASTGSYHVAALGIHAVGSTHKHLVSLVSLVDHSDVVAILNDKIKMCYCMSDVNIVIHLSYIGSLTLLTLGWLSVWHSVPNIFSCRCCEEKTRRAQYGLLLQMRTLSMFSTSVGFWKL